jgi:HSP20 family protein
MNNITRWNPIREMAAMQNAIDRMFENTWSSAQNTLTSNTLALDIHETDNTYSVVATLPGLTADDIAISMHDGTLTIAAELPQPEVAEGTRVLLQERPYGKFSRSVTLPRLVDVDSIQADYENGILYRTLQTVYKRRKVRQHNAHIVRV